MCCMAPDLRGPARPVRPTRWPGGGVGAESPRRRLRHGRPRPPSGHLILGPLPFTAAGLVCLLESANRVRAPLLPLRQQVANSRTGPLGLDTRDLGAPTAPPARYRAGTGFESGRVLGRMAGYSTRRGGLGRCSAGATPGVEVEPLLHRAEPQPLRASGRTRGLQLVLDVEDRLARRDERRQRVALVVLRRTPR